MSTQNNHASPLDGSLTVQTLKDYIGQIFEQFGMRNADAASLAESLVDADSHGTSTHGSARVISYVTQLKNGQVKAAPDERIVADAPGAVLIDADGSFGAPVGIRAVELGMQRARDLGVALVGVTNVAHFGTAGFYTRYAAERGFMALAMSSSSASVVPFGGRTPRVGNSPMSFATPGSESPELNLDFAQSMAARGKIKLLKDRGEQLPENWAIDTEGYPTTDPDEALRGAVLPSGGHKGSALSLLVEMLASGLTGAQLTQDINHSGFTGVNQVAADVNVTVGNCYLIIDTSVFGTGDEVRARATAIANYVRESPAAPGFDHVLAPGDIERSLHERTMEQGMCLHAGTAAELVELGEQLSLDVPPSLRTQAGARS